MALVDSPSSLIAPPFVFLESYRVVLVTGPQRSGTRIGAHMMAHDSGLRYVDENVFRVSDLSLFAHEWRSGGVIQCPALCRYVEAFDDPDVAVVLMRRPIDEIRRSARRIGWEGNAEELARYGLDCGLAAEYKYRYWDKHQSWRLCHPYEVSYASLAQHPLWVPAEQRRDFGPLQWRPDGSQ